MMNLISMIIVCAFIIGVIIISIIVYLEGSLKVHSSSIFFLVPLGLFQTLNVYIIMLDDYEERFFFMKREGLKLMNLAIIVSLGLFGVLTYLKEED